MADEKLGFESPNHTQTPNSFFDESLRNISSLPELKVVLAIIRKTLGWHKERDKISMSQLREVTGLHQQSVQRGIDLALKDGFITREAVGQQFFYSLKLVTPRDQSPHVTSHTTLPKPVTRGDRKLVTPRDTQKKEEIKKEKKREFWTSLKANPAYSHINLDHEINKMKAWLSLPANKDRQLTPSFILKWLNKIERPIDIPKSNGRGTQQRQDDLKRKWEGQHVKSA